MQGFHAARGFWSGEKMLEDVNLHRASGSAESTAAAAWYSCVVGRDCSFSERPYKIRRAPFPGEEAQCVHLPVMWFEVFLCRYASGVTQTLRESE